ncbi:ecotin family protein [Microbulbifer sp. TYP-18]|uniref:ecotin family protein n=1 Tax=Microbulbifer sp. TYP-18 TaxID=3230024 RepID=UPI0034C5E8F7
MVFRFVLFCLLVGLSTGVRAVDLNVFPSTVEEKRRHVVTLPKVVDESRFMVELMPGRVEQVDCNPRSYQAKLRREVLVGWGYPYFVLSDLEPAKSNRKACPETAKRRRFVRVRGENLMLPYASGTPLVVFLPPGFDLKYRIWRADKNYSNARIK